MVVMINSFNMITLFQSKHFNYLSLPFLKYNSIFLILNNQILN